MLAFFGTWIVLGYMVIVGCFRIATRELWPLTHGVGFDAPLATLVVLLAALEVAAATGGTPLTLRALNAAVAAAACLRVFFAHVRGPRSPRVDLTGRLAVVTGANTGIGLETSRELVRMGCTVVMACRSEAKASAAAADIMRSTGAVAKRVPAIALDLASMASVSVFCDSLVAQIPSVDETGIDLLVCNAGMMQPQRELTTDRIEKTMAANHFGHFALIQRLLPLLERSHCQRPSIVNVGSSLHHLAPAHFDPADVMSEKGYSMFGACECHPSDSLVCHKYQPQNYV